MRCIDSAGALHFGHEVGLGIPKGISIVSPHWAHLNIFAFIITFNPFDSHSLSLTILAIVFFTALF